MIASIEDPVLIEKILAHVGEGQAPMPSLLVLRPGRFVLPIGYAGDELAAQGGGHREYGNPLLLRPCTCAFFHRMSYSGN